MFTNVPRFSHNKPGSKLYAPFGAETLEDDVLAKGLEMVYPPGLSLESCEGVLSADHIEFSADLYMNCNLINTLCVGDFDMYPIFPLYHAHVLWSFMPMLKRGRGNDYRLSLVNVGSHLTKNKTPVIVPGFNDRKVGKKPDIVAASITFTTGKGKKEKSFELVNDAEGDLILARPFTREELAAFADGNEIKARLCVVVARSYFNLSGLLAKKPTVSQSNADMVKLILSGETPPGADWCITASAACGDSSLPRNFYIHTAAFARASKNFKNKVAQLRGKTFGFEIPTLAPDDMPVLLAVVYGTEIPLPTNLDRMGELGRTLTCLLDESKVTGVIFPQWERVICEQALALDKTSLASYKALAHLLAIVWVAPHGSLPVAKRVAIGVFADMIWLNARPGYLEIYKYAYAEESVVRRAIEEYDFVSSMEQIMRCTFTHIRMVSYVRKFGLGTKNKKMEEEKPLVSPSIAATTKAQDKKAEANKKNEKPITTSLPAATSNKLAQTKKDGETKNEKPLSTASLAPVVDAQSKKGDQEKNTKDELLATAPVPSSTPEVDVKTKAGDGPMEEKSLAPASFTVATPDLQQKPEKDEAVKENDEKPASTPVLPIATPTLNADPKAVESPIARAPSSPTVVAIEDSEEEVVEEIREAYPPPWACVIS